MNSRFWFNFLLLSVIASSLTAILFTSIYQVESRNRRLKIELFEKQVLKSLAEIASMQFDHIVADLLSLSEHHELGNYMARADSDVLHDLNNDWGAFQKRRKIYDQIRFIDTTGQERVRLNLTQGSSVMIPESRLQNKAKRYYFTDTMALDQGGVFVSPLDLNVEAGRIEEPHKPMIRFGTPVFDSSGSKRGVIILNYLANELLSRIKNDSQHSLYSQLMLVNDQGFWLSHPDHSKEWGFMLKTDERFNHDFPIAWARFTGSKAGQFYTSEGLFTFTTIKPLSSEWSSSTGSPRPSGKSQNVINKEAYTWRLISHVPQASLTLVNAELKNLYTGLWGGLTLLLTILALNWSKALASKNVALLSLQSREETMTSLLNSTSEGIYGVDTSGRCIFINKAARALLGYEEDQMIGKKIHELIAHYNEDGSTRPAEECLVIKVLKTGNACINDDSVLRKKDGDWLNVEYRIHPIKKSDQTNGAVVTFLDISEKKKILEQRVRSGQLSSLGELSAGMAHEINNPITGVINYTQILLNKSKEGSQEQDILSRIIKESNRIAKIVHNLLNFAHMDRESKVPVAVESIVTESIQLVEQQLLKDGITLDVDLNKNLPMILGNAQKLEQVLLNLISNARHTLNEKYPGMVPDKILRISASQVGGKKSQRLQLVVWDQGNGMSKEILAKIFNRFFTTKPAGVGTGLGLGISHDILEEHGATIHLESEVGCFTKVVMEFPVVEQKVLEPGVE